MITDPYQDEKNYDPAAREAERAEITHLLSNINIPALVSRASDLRNGMPCSLPRNLGYDRSTRSLVTGGMNYHIEIQFEDGVVWLARIRRNNATSPPLDLQRYIMRSEIATLQFLRKTKIPAPEVFDYNFEKGPVGVEYILMEKMAGKSLRWSLATSEQRTKVISQLVDVYAELQRYPFELMGSLDQPGTDHVGPFAWESLTDYIDSRMRPIGPLTSSRGFWTAYLRLTLDFIMRRERYSTCPVDAYLIHRFLLDCVPNLFSSHDADGPFYLKHADDKGDHILVDDDYNITGIVDWEWAHTDCPSVAFNSPILLLPVAEFYDGAAMPGEDELHFAQFLEDKGHGNIAEKVRNGRAIHLFNFCSGYDLADWDGFVGLFYGLRRALDPGDNLDWDGWKEKAMSIYKDDTQLKELLSTK